MRHVLNHAMLALAVSLGRRTGLLETLARLPPSTSVGIADAAGLDERYVREWLGAMVTGRIVDYDGSHGTYWLPPEHAAVLTDAAGGAGHGAGHAVRPGPRRGWKPRWPAASGADAGSRRRAARVERPARGGDRPASRTSLIDEVLALVPGMVERLRSGIDVLELGAGDDGRGCWHGHFPASRFVTGDLSSLGERAPSTW